MPVLAYPAPELILEADDNNGHPLAGGLLYTYAAGTTTPIATYADAGTVATNTNPVVLNFRGEAPVFLLPNVAYKFLLTDSLGNTIPGYPVDNVIGQQTPTLYGGVDTGGVNAYILNFTANFSAYADGIIIYWIPANTNTGPSTINVNGLGVVNIVNPDGSVLTSAEIIANQPAQILFKGGQFELITPAVTLQGSFNVTWADYGGSPPPTVAITYRRTGNLVALAFPANNHGTSTNTGFTATGVPTFLRSSIGNQLVMCPGLLDNGVTQTASVANVVNNGVIAFYKDATLGNWTAAGVKGMGSPGPTIVYLL